MKKINLKKQLFLLAFLVSINFITSAQIAGWGYMMPVKVTENAGMLLINHQLSITVNTQALITANEMQSNGNDIRFGNDCQGSILYNYWIDSGLNTPNTVIWVKIDTLQPHQTKTIFMFFGNPSAPAVSSIPLTFVGPLSSTDSITGGTSGGAANSQRGFRFHTKQNILVTDFGKDEPTGSTRYVTLFNFATNAIVVQGQVSGAAGQYDYAALVNPLWLAPGTQYVIELYQGATDGYYYQTSSQINPHLVYGDMRYCNTCTQNTYPTTVLAGYQYGYPDFWFYITTDTVSPAPSYYLDGILTPLNITAQATPADTVCSGNSVTLNGGGANSYSWSGGETNNVAFIPTGTTTFTVIGTDTVGCIGTDSVQVVVNVCSGINNLLSKNNDVSIYPNPASNLVNLDFSTTLKGEKTINLYDISDRLILSETTDKETLLLNLSAVSEGVYYLKVTRGNSFVAAKSIVVIK